MSTFVSLDTALPNSAPTAAARNAPAGPPDTVKPNTVASALAPMLPVIALAKSTIGGDLSPQATATPIAGPIRPIARFPVSIQNSENAQGATHISTCSPTVFIIRPMSSEEKSPSAIAESAS